MALVKASLAEVLAGDSDYTREIENVESIIWGRMINRRETHMASSKFFAAMALLPKVLSSSADAIALVLVGE